MPLEIIESPGDTELRAISKNQSGASWDTIHDAILGSLQPANSSGRPCQVRKAGSNYFFIRGILAYDLRDAGLPLGIKVVRAQLVIGGTTAQAADTNGDKIRVGVVSNPRNSNAVNIKGLDYSIARYDANSYTSAQAVPNGSDDVIINLDNKRLLNRLQFSINQKKILHLSVRNELDFLDDPDNVSGLNRVAFSPPSAQGSSVDASTFAKLRIFYRIIGKRRNPGGRGAGGVASAGFGGVSMFCGTNSGFSS
tara:strand:+ start:13072 stop:13827 length:756 start_codon:yes stop_codon:yes gene_type:complete